MALSVPVVLKRVAQEHLQVVLQMWFVASATIQITVTLLLSLYVIAEDSVHLIHYQNARINAEHHLPVEECHHHPLLESVKRVNVVS